MYLSVYLSIYLSVYLTSFLSFYLSIYLTENVLSARAIENGYVRFPNGTIRAVDDDARKRRYFVFTFTLCLVSRIYFCIIQYTVKYNTECF